MSGWELYQEVCRAMNTAGYTCTGAGSHSANRVVTQSSVFWRGEDCVTVCLQQTVLAIETGELSDGEVTVSSAPQPLGVLTSLPAVPQP